MLCNRLIILLLLLLSGCSFDSQSDSVIIKNGTSIEERIKIYQSLVKGMCNNEEKINRHFLQQTWYHSKEFKSFAYIFGTSSFTEHEKNKALALSKIEAFYCIDGNNINALYYEKNFVPGDLSLKKRTLHYDEKLTFLKKETIKVIAINHHEMILSFLDSNTQENFYRKN